MHDMIHTELVTLQQMLEKYDGDSDAHFLRQVIGRLMKRLLNQIPAYDIKQKEKNHSQKLSVQLQNLANLMNKKRSQKIMYEKSQYYDF